VSHRILRAWLRRCAAATALLAFVCAAAGACQAQSDAVVCRGGAGNFEAAFPTGVSVQVGAARREGFARRECEAALLWDKGKVTVTTGVAQVDLDAFGVDAGLGAPVAAFQVRKSNSDCCMTLQLYSLRKPPKMLRTITGGSFFKTADTDLDGQVEIWTDDAAALEGFENPIGGRSDLAPTVVLRFEHGRLVDVGSEFRGYFDSQIARLRAQLAPEDLREFKSSSGRLPATAHFSPEDLRRSEKLERTKERVLQVVWAYLYSGREQEAWNQLAEFWPAADLERIRAAIMSARARGIRAQVDGVSTKISAGAEKRAEIFDARTIRGEQPGSKQAGAAAERARGVAPPTPILIGHRAAEGQREETLPDSGIMLDLVIDAAGKVRSAESADPAFDASLKDATASWKFIPAIRDGRAIASRIYFIVTPKR
jgi:hypothetical protein